ncbi:MAG: NFACT family protein [Clostridiales bacterium]|nr:NFACT family protein [Clostridiales bacterium]
MAYDALTLSILRDELSDALIGGKITKIYQPERDEIILFIFNKQTYKLLISSNAGVNRIHITEMPTDNPKTAPSFCMLLRKHLINATITGISQMPYERVLEFDLQVNDELGYKKNMKLIFELTGKTSNIILTDDGYTILDSIKHLPQDLDSKRIIICGAKYAFFSPQVKILPFDLPRVREFLSSCNTPLRKTLPEVLLGVSTSTVNEMLYQIDENDHTIVNHSLVVDRIAQYRANLKNKRPNVVLRDGNPVDVNPFDYQSVKGEKIYFDTLNRAHDYYYYLLDKTQRAASKAKSISTVVKNAISRTEKKLAIQRQSVLEAKSREQFKHFGDLILSNIWQIKQGSETLNCYDYETEQNVTIPLDKQLPPQQNAQFYYKKYRKLKSSAEHNGKLIEENTKLLEYLTTIKASLKYCVEADDLQQIRDELVELGLIREKQQSKKKVDTPLKPLRYDVNGYTVYVGKNNAQNNYVTFKLAKTNDLWLHTQKIHSSHVVIVNDKNSVIPDSVIVTAAEICAYYSQANSGSKITVDYTAKSNVKKPNKAPLGFVVYDTYKTVLVNPDRHVTLLRQ